ncbi:MAG: helix-turn-helix domain-containing protein [Dermatophilaceae bacterium]
MPQRPRAGRARRDPARAARAVRDKSRTANALGISRTTLYARIRALGISRC